MSGDSKAVRRYHAGVERALGLFDSTSEWADFIAYLGRLLKALQDPPDGADLPMKGTIAHHLAQCLRPALPSGVHQKALDVYAVIFTNIGPDGLSKDLPLYLPGLSHTFGFASLSTRPQLLSIFDEHILQLDTAVLRPALRALILALLPSLEEETSEDFERTLASFNKTRTKFTNAGQGDLFWQNLFLASITSPNRRAGVLVFLTKYLPKLATKQHPHSTGANNAQDNAEDLIVRPEPGLLVRCFATGLQDDQPLIQRGFLDLLVTRLPLDALIFRAERHSKDLDVLVRSAALVVLRRDMGLNRRLWTWFTGSDAKSPLPLVVETNGDADTSVPEASTPESKTHRYFSEYGLKPLIRGIQAMISASTKHPTQRAQPFRVALSLMDRWEIGGPVVEAVFVPLIQNLQTYQSSAPSQEAFDEVFRSANVFFDGVEGRLVASQIIKLLEQDDFDLIHFLLTNFNLEDDEMMKRHIPLICLLFAQRLSEALSENQNSDVKDHAAVVDKITVILEELTKLTGNGVLIDSGEMSNADNKQSWQVQIRRFYEMSSGSAKSIMLPLSKSQMTSILTERLCGTFIYFLHHPSPEYGALARISACIERCIGLVQGYATLSKIGFCSQMLHCIESQNDSDRSTFESTTSVARIIATLSGQDTTQEALTSAMLSQFIPVLTTQLWKFLHPSTPQYHVETVESIWRLHNLSPDLELVESTILTIMTSVNSSHATHRHNVLRFATLWTHSRTVSKQIRASQTPQTPGNNDEGMELLKQPLLFLIDCAGDSDPHNNLALWARSLSSLGALFHITLDSRPSDFTDQQLLGLALKRLSTLTSLAATSTSLWDSFCKHPLQGSAVLEFCSSVLSKQAFANTLAVRALALVQLMLKNGQYQLSNEFISLLSTQLAATVDKPDLQGALLDTLQAALTGNQNYQPTDMILQVLLDGLSSLKSDIQIDKFVTLLCTVIPAMSTPSLMTNLLKITETICIRLEAIFQSLQKLCVSSGSVVNGHDVDDETASNPDRSISNLLGGVEYVLARAHHQAAVSSEEHRNGSNTPASDPVKRSRSSANDHLTVVLCMQDVLKSCAKIWLWRASGRTAAGIADLKSLHYISSKLRAKSRRILENLIEAEPQECLETLMGLWVGSQITNPQQGQVLDLLQTLDGARPKFMMPATFNAIYNRTNPSALDQSQRSSLSVDVNAFQLIAFLNDYTNALEDDLLDEIWTDCTTFLKEILANPMPHRQILLKLLEFAAVLCNKMENTNFVEESRMRKELADILARLFMAIFTIKPSGLDGGGSSVSESDIIFNRARPSMRHHLESGHALQILYETLPDLSICLAQSDRLITIYTGIATNMTSPMLHAKNFPQNLSPEVLALLHTISTAPSATKAWKKDVTDAFNDSRFFQCPVQLVERGWLPLIRSLALTEKTLLPELLNRLIPPAAAGLMFGVGATAARTEADKRTQLSLRRIILVLLSMEPDSFIPQLQHLFLKLQELLTATPDSSPSSSTRSDIYLTIRSILLSFSQSNLATLWPILDTELHDLCTDMITTPDRDDSKLTMYAKLHGAKLLDLLLLLKPDEFQLHEWLFVTDTVDAIYPPNGLEPIALADRIGASASVHADYALEVARTPTSGSGAGGGGQGMGRKPWLCTDDSRDPEKFVGLLSNFFSQLSIRAFEGNYSLQKVDMAACRRDLIADLFAET